jgi:hypothetical protein
MPYLLQLNRLSFLKSMAFAILLFGISCRKPCSEEPEGTTPLDQYSMRIGITTGDFLNAVNVIFPEDSIFLFDDEGRELSLDWSNDSAFGTRTQRIAYFKGNPDNFPDCKGETRPYRLEINDFGRTLIDTLTISYTAQQVECGRVLDPVKVRLNGDLVDVTTTGTISIFTLNIER